MLLLLGWMPRVDAGVPLPRAHVFAPDDLWLPRMESGRLPHRRQRSRLGAPGPSAPLAAEMDGRESVRQARWHRRDRASHLYATTWAVARPARLEMCMITRAVSIGGSSFGHPSSNRAPLPPPRRRSHSEVAGEGR